MGKQKMSTGKNEQILCRICLKSGIVGRNIFQTFIDEDLVVNILIECTDVEASLDDKLPAIICTMCLDTLELLNEFRGLVKKSDALLRETIVSSTDEKHEPEMYNLEDFKAEYLDENEVATIDSVEIMPENEVLGAEEESLIEYEVVEIETEVTPTAEIVEPSSFNCCSCKETFTNPQSLRGHFEIAHPTLLNTTTGLKLAPFQCGLCTKQFPNVACLKRHQSHYQNLIACTMCGREVTRSLMAQHINAHHEFQECDVCQKVFKRSGLNEHKEKMHSTDRFDCELCSKQFTNKIYLKRHISTVHSPRDPNKLVYCTADNCKKSFANQSVLRKHMRIHNGEKPYQCQFCSATYTHNTDHRRHLWTHTGSPHQCEKCGKSFDRPAKLQKHNCARACMPVS